jgi:Bacteriocin-protection, YdeI or OmpD-Associated/Domain of unknown function (DUF1905)
MVQFRTVLLGDGNTLGIPVPPEVVEGLGAGKRVPVVVTIGDYSYRNSVAPYRGEYMISLSSDNRARAGVSGGDEVEVTIEVDTAPREVEVPPDFADALRADAAATAAFEKLSYSNKSRHVLSIEGAKTPETRQRRIDKAIGELRGNS